MVYRKIRRYKYKLIKDEVFVLDDNIGHKFENEFFKIFYDSIIVKSGYAWDGASGFTIDTKNSMRASLIHDVFYQCLREEILPLSLKEYADSLFKKILIQDGMNKIRANIWYIAVKRFGENSVKPSNFKLVAP
ncbi:MAG TPA: DUF1353 domain-containing protein [Candidatus Paceibacterota bacterium]|nr:DUF1353 domain-containing protein [Candidatus Paceibacterota bacterium]